MTNKSKKEIEREWKERSWTDLNKGIEIMRKEIKEITHGDNFTFITDEKDNIRKWCELEKACYALELIARQLKRIARMNVHVRAKQLIKEIMEDT